MIRLFPTYTPVYGWVKNSIKRFIINQGGTSSSKTVSILQRLAHIACEEPGVTITVCAATSDALLRGAVRDFKNLIKDSLVLEKLLVNSRLVAGPYEFVNGSVIEFIHLDDEGNARSGKRDYLFLNEVNQIHKGVCDQLIARTSRKIFMDYNSDAEFWIHEEYINKVDVDFFISNFTHNPYCPEEVINTLFGYKYKGEETGSHYWKNKWQVYGLGMTGVVEGVIFDNINWVNFYPIVNRVKQAYLLDFGFKNDPTALSKACEVRKEIYAKELVYDTGLTTPDILDIFIKFKISKKDLIIADSANLDAIAQMQRKGYNVVPASKPPGSVLAGLNALREKDINITKDSVNWKKEQENYKYKQIRGRFVNEPIDDHNHLWDGLRYWNQYFYPPKISKGKKPIRKMRVIN